MIDDPFADAKFRHRLSNEKNDNLILLDLLKLLLETISIGFKAGDFAELSYSNDN